mgnify:CR=1 FL=1
MAAQLFLGLVAGGHILQRLDGAHDLAVDAAQRRGRHLQPAAFAPELSIVSQGSLLALSGGPALAQAPAEASLSLRAVLTSEAKPLRGGLTWRIYEDRPEGGKPVVGLGPALCQRVLAHMGGRLKLDETRDGRARITVALRAAPQEG